VSLFDGVAGGWVGVLDGLSRPGAGSALGEWVDAAFVGIDVVSLKFPVAQLLKFALLMPDVVGELDEKRWLASFDASAVVPEGAAFVDPNAFRVVQVPWRFDGLEGAALGERVVGDERSRLWPWGGVVRDGGVVPVRVRVPVMGLSEGSMAGVRVAVAVTEEHSIVVEPGAARSPLTGTAAAPIARAPRFLVVPVGWESVSGYAVRGVTLGVGRGERVESPLDVGWVERLEGVRALPLRPDFAGASSFVFEGSVPYTGWSALGYESSVFMGVEREGSGSWVFSMGVEASLPVREDGRAFSDGQRSFTLDHRDGVALLALPNVPGLRVDYDAVVVEGFDRVAGRWEELPNAYAGPARSAALDRVGLVAAEMLAGAAFGALAGERVALASSLAGIVVDVAGLSGLVEPEVVEESGGLPLPVDSAFVDANRFRLVQVPWEVGLTVPGWGAFAEDALRFVNPYRQEEGVLRLRVRVPVEGLSEADVGDVRGFVAAVERVVRWEAVGWSDALGRASLEPSLVTRRLVSGTSLAVDEPPASPADDVSTDGPIVAFALEGFSVVPPLTAERQTSFSGPAMVLDPDLDYAAVIETNRGSIVVDLFEERTPVTVNNFVFLALHRFYDGIVFHRVIDGFMAQAGDPTGTGTGGPGYSFADEIVEALQHDGPGVMSMANAGPGTNGSQFFLTFDATPWLDGVHTVFGRVVEGLEVLDHITRVDPSGANPTAAALLDEPADSVREQGVQLAGTGTVAEALVATLGFHPEPGRSFEVAGFRGVIGTMRGEPAAGFFPFPDWIEQVTVLARPRGAD